MPHIHTEPNQHDMTISAYVIRREATSEFSLDKPVERWYYSA